MTPDQYAEIQKIFLELREQDEDSQKVRLRELHQSNAIVADEVRQLLAVDGETGLFIDKPLINRQHRVEIETQDMRQPNTDSRDDIEIPTHIGPYRILQKIGEGGHGVVFMAEQLKPIRRKVAIKWIKRGMDSNMILARFEAEWQALAMMKHPSIANVIEAKSTDSGQPYFVMELVHGIPIDEFCNQNRLDLPERLRLFQQVCSAVHHAHQKGIIHRDIKPANVLVTTDSGKPLAKVIDFGIAKALHMPLTEKTMFTEYGQIVGTLEFMSPEQALMSQTGIDVRSDVYSLGVLLYLLLTGETPVSRKELLREGIWELKKILQSTQPQNPSMRITSRTDPQKWRDHVAGDASWVKNVSGDLDWITMKAIDRAPERRYDSAAEFSNDIDRFLSGDAIEARPPSRWYSLQKFVGRNRIAVAASAAVGLSLLSALVAFSLLYFQSTRNLRLLEQKSTQLKETATRAKEYSQELEKTLSRQTLETAWQTAISGDFKRAMEQMERVPVVNRKAAWNLAGSLAKQYQRPVFRTDFESNVRVLEADEFSKRLAIVNTVSVLEVWDTNSLELVHEVELPPGSYSAIAFSNDDSILVCSPRGLLLVDLRSETYRKATNVRTGSVRAVAFDEANGSWWLTTGSNSLIQIDAKSLQQRSNIALDERLKDIAVSADGKQIIVATVKGNLIIVDTGKETVSKTFRGKGNEIRVVRFDSKTICAADDRGNLFEISMEELAAEEPTSKLLRIAKSRKQPVAGTLGSAASLFVGYSDGSIWHVAPKRHAPVHVVDGAPRELVFINSLERLLIVHPGGQISVVDSAELNLRKSLASLPNKLSDGFGHHQKQFAATLHNDGALKLWNTSDGTILGSTSAHQGEALELDVNSSGTLAASVGLDRKMKLSTLPSLEPTHDLSISWGVRTARFSADDSLIAGPAAADNATNNREGTFDIWDAKAGIPVRRFVGHKNWILQFQFLNEERLASLSVDGTAKIWDIESGECLTTIDYTAFANATCFVGDATDNHIFIGHADGVISSWNRNSGILTGSKIVASAPVAGLSFVDRNCEALIIAIQNESELLLFDRSLQSLATFESGIGPLKAFRAQNDSIMLVSESGLVKILKQ